MTDQPLIEELKERLARTTEALKESELRFDHLVRGTQGLICTHDLAGVLLSVNPAACDILGYTQDEMVGHNLAEFLPAERMDTFPLFLEKMNNEGAATGRLLLVGKDGGLRTFQYHNVCIDGVTGRYVLGHAYDVSELLDLQRKLEELTVTDDLTGLYNRRGFLSQAAARIKLAERNKDPLSIIFADIDGLKKINDTHGHATGSQLIIDAASVLKDSFRQTDVLSRWGGDEFVALLGLAPNEGRGVVVERIERKIDDFNAASPKAYALSMSLGVVPLDPADAASLDKLIAEADHKMYEEKRRRKT